MLLIHTNVVKMQGVKSESLLLFDALSRAADQFPRPINRANPHYLISIA
jgi:hypothetical protein